MSIRLAAAGLPAGPDVVSLLPGSQILVVGARALFLWALLAGIMAAGVIRTAPWLIAVVRRASTQRRLGHRLPTWRVLAALAVVNVALIALAVILRSSGPGAPPRDTYYVPATVLALAVGSVIACVRFLRRGASPERMLGRLLLATAIVASTLLPLAMAADERTQLSRVIVETKDHRCVEAPLVASTDRGFYLADGRNGAIALIARDEVVRSVIQRRKLTVDASLILSGACPRDMPRH
jgi:hypothetical protein